MTSEAAERPRPASRSIAPLAIAAVATACLATATGAAGSASLMLAALPLALVGAIALASFEEGLGRVFLAALGVLLFGYAFLGRGFAHLGAPPVYFAEPVLAMGLLAAIIALPRVRLIPLHFYLFAFIGWGAARTVPYVATDGVDALRDAVTWAYALFAVAISVIVRPDMYETIAGWFRKLAPWFLAWVPVLFLSNQFLMPYLPLAPGTDVHIPFFQPGDVGVHLAGIAAFLLTGLYATQKRLPPGAIVLLVGLWVFAFVVCGAINRGAFVACVAAFGLCFLLKPSSTWLVGGVAAMVLLAVLAAINPTLPVEGRDREASVQQAMRNVSSILSGSADPALEPTRRWRLAWWDKIVDYTVFGPYFWQGKGFGVNLADDDGFQVTADRSLRSPHNTHLTILARMGVPGLFLWLSLSGIFGLALLNSVFIARRAGETFRAAFASWLLVYWLAMMVNGSFSLYLEAPQEGIWFWTVFGLGLAVLRDDYVPYVWVPRRRVIRYELPHLSTEQRLGAAAVFPDAAQAHPVAIQGSEPRKARRVGRRLDTAS